MSDRESLIDNLLRRRVLQFVGMYIAATWLVIELGDWVTERFNLPADFTSYVFIAMLVLLPSVIIFAYGHGAPGKDKWTRFERIFIPLNVTVAAAAIFLIDPTYEVEAATQFIQIADETGQVQEFEVARRGYHREVVSFSWTNASGETGLDWLSYGLPGMLATDIDRISPVISVATPFNSDSLRDRLKRQASAIDIPRSLAVQIARDRRSAALVTGSFDVDGDTFFLFARVIDAGTGEVIGEHEVRATDWLDGVDRVSAAVLAMLEVRPADNKNDEPIRQHFSDSIDAIRHYTEGEVAIAFENDYPAGIAGYTKAVELDPQFAEARGALSIGHYLNGNLEAAREEATRALRDGYRLADSSKFALKAQRYIYDGDFERGQRVLDIWTEVQPNSPRAYSSQARLLRLQGGRQALDKAQVAYDQLLELNPANIGVYISKAEVEQQRGDYAAAAAYLQQYLELDPDSGEARLRLASVYQADGDLDQARQVLEYAAVLLDDPVEPGLALARLQARRGDYDAAVAYIDDLLAANPTQQQRFQLLNTRIEILGATGRVREALEAHAVLSEVALELLPPTIRQFTVGTQKSGLLAQIGNTEEAVAILDAILANLQPPQSHYMSVIYSGLYSVSGDREAAREWAERSIATRDQMPEPMQLLITIGEAQLAAWDGEHAEALRLTDIARERLGASYLQLFESDLGVFSMYVGLAELYMEAGEHQKAEAELEQVLKLYPGNGEAKVTLARSLVLRGELDRARQLLAEARTIYANADSDFVFLGRIESLQAEIEAAGTG